MRHVLKVPVPLLLLVADARTLLDQVGLADRADQLLFLGGDVIVEQGPAARVIGDPREERTRRFLKRILDPS